MVEPRPPASDRREIDPGDPPTREIAVRLA
jgi:hypothetical protein